MSFFEEEYSNVPPPVATIPIAYVSPRPSPRLGIVSLGHRMIQQNVTTQESKQLKTEGLLQKLTEMRKLAQFSDTDVWKFDKKNAIPLFFKKIQPHISLMEKMSNNQIVTGEHTVDNLIDKLIGLMRVGHVKLLYDWLIENMKSLKFWLYRQSIQLSEYPEPFMIAAHLVNMFTSTSLYATFGRVLETPALCKGFSQGGTASPILLGPVHPLYAEESMVRNASKCQRNELEPCHANDL